jgi:hypothetical protein
MSVFPVDQPVGAVNGAAKPEGFWQRAAYLEPDRPASNYRHRFSRSLTR